MKGIIITIILLSSLIANAQIIDFNNFSEERMNQVMFDEMNKYVKRLHHGDSLIWSAVVQQDIMNDNYNFIRNNRYLPLQKLHNQKWLGRPWNDLPDTIRAKIIDEMSKYPDSTFIKRKYFKEYKTYLAFTYTEILKSFTYGSPYPTLSYQDIAQRCITDWNQSPAHATYMNANYKNVVIVGVATYFNKKGRTIFISFVHVS
jgi:hypothetical protein